MMPVLDIVNHDYSNDTGLIMVNKQLHVDPTQSNSYFKSGKYLNDVRLVYNTSESESDIKARANSYSIGY